jgi:hypothetical protein
VLDYARRRCQSRLTTSKETKDSAEGDVHEAAAIINAGFQTIQGTRYVASNLNESECSLVLRSTVEGLGYTQTS